MNKQDQFKKRLYEFTLRLVEFIEHLPKDLVSRRIGDQLLRSGTSIIANYVEGKASNSKKEFINYFAISLKSANESKLWFALLRDTKKALPEQVNGSLGELDEIAKIFGKSIVTMKKNSKK